MKLQQTPRGRALAAALLLILAGCGASPPTEPETVVYFDLATRGPVLAEARQATPAVHPLTGRRTLVPAAYCPACQEWHAAPPLEQLQRNPRALICPKTRARMSFDGPRPPA